MKFGDQLTNLIYLFLFLVATFAVPLTAYRRRNRSYSVQGSSVLVSYYTDGAQVMPMKKGCIGGMHYSAMVTMPPLGRSDSAVETALLYRVELPYSSKIHLVAVPKQSGTTQLNPAAGRSLMEEVDLEGDYYKYFTLYCDKGMQTEARYVLDPKAMAFTIDFCRSQNWEIIKNELYFLQEVGSSSPNDPTDIFDDIESFVLEIRPAVEKPLSIEEQKAQTPYGTDRRNSLPCPVCTAGMTNTGEYFSCPSGHGILVAGNLLPNVIKIARPYIKETSTALPDRSTPLTCPSCGARMAHVSYNSSGTVVDSCPNCVYRWLDTGEKK